MIKRDSHFVGFTLLEMVMVLVVIGLLVTIIVPKFTTQLENAKEAQTRANMENLRSALAIYSKDYGGYPAALSALPTNIMRTVPAEDAWGQAWTYDPATGEINCTEAAGSGCDENW